MAADWYSDDKATMGDRLTAAREAAGLDVRELATRLGVRRKTLQAWENDESEPRANHLRMLSGMLGVSLVWMLSGEGPGVGDQPPPAAPADQATLSELRALQAALRDALARTEKLQEALSDG